MKVTTERLPKSVVALDIELEQQQVEKGLDRAARKLSQKYSIPGFRPGKAPRFIVENYLGRARIMEEASDDLINKAFQDALKQEQISPVGKASLENVEEKPFRFRVTVPVEPAVELTDYRSYQLPYEPEPVSDETVQKLLDAQREQHSVLRELEEPRPAQEGDMLTVTMTSDLDEDEEVDDEVDEEQASDEDAGELEGRQLALVEGRVRPEIYQTLIGAQPGETRTVTVHHGEDDEDETLRGRDVTYTIEVMNVQERLLPDWDELPTLTDFDGDFEALRANARARLAHAAEERARKSLLDAFVERAVAETPLEIPEAMIEERAGKLFHEQVAQFSRYGLTEDQYLSATGRSHEEAVAEFHAAAEQDVRRSLVLRELIRREDLNLSPEDVSAELDRFLEDYGPERRQEVLPLLQSPNMTTMIASSALDRKLRDRLVGIATGQAQGAGQESGATANVEAGASGVSGSEATLETAPIAEMAGPSEQPEAVGSSEADKVESAS